MEVSALVAALIVVSMIIVAIAAAWQDA